LVSLFPENDPRVWQEGLEKCGIQGSMIGVPITLHTRVGPTVVAVVLLWHASGGRFSKELSEEFVRRCTKEMSLELRVRKSAGAAGAAQ